MSLEKGRRTPTVLARRPFSRSDWVKACVALVVVILLTINPGLADWGNAFSADVPVEQWFQHRLQFDPIIGCGTEFCQ